MSPDDPAFEDFRAATREAFGANMRRFREARGWTQEQLAEELGFSLQYTQRLEWGRHNVPLDTLARVAFVLGCKPAELLR